MTIQPSEISDDEELFEVMPVNWDSLRAFLAVETQWRVAATYSALIWLGLDYVAVDLVLRRRNAPDAVFADIQEMESEAIAAFSEVSD